MSAGDRFNHQADPQLKHSRQIIVKLKKFARRIFQMSDLLPASLLSEFSEVLAARTGLYFPLQRWLELKRGLGRVAAEMECANTESCLRRLLDAPLAQNEIEMLASHLTVGETYFFREQRQFDALEQHILTELIASRQQSERRIRIWSAGCCTGEEPYSIAITLDRLLPDFRGWDITILATDLNPLFLQKARRGVYHNWSFRTTPSWIKDRYFTRVAENAFEIKPRIRERVTFSYLNLAEDIYPALINNTNAMDVIFCRNVLMYFKPEYARQATQRFHASLMPEGYLIVSPVEAATLAFAPFQTVNVGGAVLFRKAGQPEPMPDQSIAPLPEIPPEVSEAFNALEVPAPSAPERIQDTATTLLQVNGFEQAAQWYRVGEYDRAAECITTWRANHPEHAPSLTLLARIYANQGKLGDALIRCQQAISINKLDPDTHYLQALIQQECGMLELAVQSLKRTLYLQPDHVLAHFTLGYLAQRQGDVLAAGKHFRHALERLRSFAPDDPVPESEGLTARQLAEVIQPMVIQETVS